MKILKLILHKHLRLLLNNIQHFEIDTTALIHLILGRNGCGKSSVLDELCPLPGLPQKYGVGGYKIIEIEFNGNHYSLESHFTGTAKHHFIKNGANLNPGGTITVQRDLVKDHFNYTSEIHALITGKEKFTTMSASRRKYWFTRLPNTDYSLAIATYEKFKDKTNQYKQGLKAVQRRLMIEKDKLMSEEQYSELRVEVASLEKELQQLYDHKSTVPRAYNDVLSAIEASEREITAVSKKLLKMGLYSEYRYNKFKEKERDEWGTLEYPVFQSLGELNDVINLCEKMEVKFSTEIETLTDEHNRLSKICYDLRDTENVDQSSDGAHKSIESLKQKIKDLEDQLDFNTGIENKNALNALSTMEAIESDLTDTLMSMSDNRDGIFSRDAWAQQDRKMADLKFRLNIIQSKDIPELKTRIEHYEEHQRNNTTKCPQCSHKWVTGIDLSKYELLKIRLSKLQEEEGKLLDAVESTAMSLEDQEKYKTAMTRYRNITVPATILNPFWEMIASAEKLRNAPRSIINDVIILKRNLNISAAIHSCELEIQKKMMLLESMIKAGSNNLAELESRLETIEKRVEALTKSKHAISGEIDGYKEYYKTLNIAGSSAERLKALVTNVESMTFEGLDALKSEIVNQCIRNTQVSLGEKVKILSDEKHLIERINDHEEHIISLEQQYKVAKYLMDEMSPTTGLIAKGLLGYIQYFIQQMNEVIAEIWTYPMIIKECAPDGEDASELNYLFPYYVDHQVKPNPDVSEGSTGQLEIIDLAFVMTAMRSLNMDNYPLVLDEFGKTFDSGHQFQATKMITEIMETQNYSQLFMVSHYAGNYSMLNSAEICVLDKTNIVVPEKYNQNVVITH